MKKSFFMLFGLIISLYGNTQKLDKHSISIINAQQKLVKFSSPSFRTLYHDIEKTNFNRFLPNNLDELQYKIDQYKESKSVPVSLIYLQSDEAPIFGASLNRTMIYSSQVNYIFNQELIQTNSDISNLKIDFDDRKGIQSIPLNSSYTINYQSPGIKNIKVYKDSLVRIIPIHIVFMNDVARSSSRSSIRLPHQTIKVEGVQDVFSSCDGNLGKTYGYAHILYSDSSIKKMNKPVIFVEGLDLNKSSVYDSTYGDTVRFGNFGWDSFVTGYASSLEDITLLPSAVDTLLYYGFDVILLDFKFGGDYIQKNAEVLIQLIHQMNDSLELNGSCEKLSVIGASMGGIISRYAINKMEKNGLRHNVKVYMSFDSPHQGGNVPLSIQCFTHFVGVRGGNQGALDGWNGLNSPAPLQLTPFHMAYYPDTINCLNVELYDELKIDGYPTQTRFNVALTNGSGKGIGQGYGSGDIMLDVDFDPFYVNATFIAKGYATSGKVSTIPNMSEYYYGKYDDDPVNIFDTDLEDTYYFPDTVPLLDISPGGITTLMATDVIPSIEDAVGASYINHYEPGNSFIPVTSGFDLKVHHDSLFFNVDTHKSILDSLSPFDKFYYPDSNEYHIQITEENIQFIKNSLLIDYREIDSTKGFVCENDTIQVFGNNVFSEGYYSDTIVSSFNGCDSLIQVKHIEYRLRPDLIAGANTSNADVQTSIQFIATSSDTNNITWDFGDSSLSNLTNPTHSFDSEGQYNVIVTNEVNGCSTLDTLTITIQNALSSVNEYTQKHILIYPNPAKNQQGITISSDKISWDKILILNSAGQIIRNFDNKNVRKNEIQISGIDAGIYYIYINVDKTTYIEKLIIVD